MIQAHPVAQSHKLKGLTSNHQWIGMVSRAAREHTALGTALPGSTDTLKRHTITPLATDSVVHAITEVSCVNSAIISVILVTSMCHLVVAIAIHLV